MVKIVVLLTRWLQIIPIGLLMIFPYSDLKLRLEPWRHRFISVSYMAIFCATLWALSSASVLRHWDWDLGLAFLLILFFSGWVHGLQTSVVHKFLTGSVMLHFAAMLNAIGNIFVAVASDANYLPKLKTGVGLLLFCLIFLLVISIFWLLSRFFLRGILGEKLPVLGRSDAKRTFFYECVLLVLFCLAAYNPSHRIESSAPAVTIVLVLTNMIACTAFFYGGAIDRNQIETVYTLAVQEMQYRQFSRTIKENRSLRLAMHQHFNELMKLSDERKQDEIANYLKQHGAVYNQPEGINLSGDPVVKTVLEYYLSKAADEKIPVECKVTLTDGIAVNAMDMTVLLSNCLDHAMEVLRTLPQETRGLHIVISSENASLVFIIESNCGHPDRRGNCTNDGPEPYGADVKSTELRRVYDIAKKYDGTSIFWQSKREFSVWVILPMRGQDNAGLKMYHRRSQT